MRRAFALAGLIALIALIATACAGGDSTAASPSQPSSGSPPTGSPSASLSASQSAGPDLSNAAVRLEKVASLDAPLAMAVRQGDEALYIAEKGGQVVALRGGSVDQTPVLDVTRLVSTGSEQGLLGLAFSRDGGFLYVNYTDANGDTNVVEYRMDGDRADPASARRVLFVDQPFSNHNGGNLVFGPDGYLYIGMGDGGSQGDPHGNGQNLGVLLAKMLRIDPRPAGGKPYGIPPDNPFVGRAGARPEIWAYGLRNPWRYEFDRETGDLWIGDVGGSQREEIDVQPTASNGGENYGWNLVEGTVPHSDNIPQTTPPVYDYPHSGGRCVVTGGFVYRGLAIPDLVGAYLFTDYCQGELMAMLQENGKMTKLVNLRVTVDLPVSFGEDQAGELYVLSLSGAVSEIVPA
jgi:glucose/arabinose dehydrogenase